jgi:hypothetical protein
MPTLTQTSTVLPALCSQPFHPQPRRAFHSSVPTFLRPSCAIPSTTPHALLMNVGPLGFPHSRHPPSSSPQSVM